MFIDISRPIHAHMAIYPNNPSVDILKLQEAEHGQSQLSAISLGSHTGTHIDGASHIVSNAPGIEEYTLSQYIGPVDVVEVSSDVSVIHTEHIPKLSSSRVLFKTRNSSGNIDIFDENFVALGEDAAEELVRRKIELVGIDALSIKKKGVRDNVHNLFLDARVVILEGLWLQDVAEGQYQLICLPLSVAHIDGVPARAVLAPSSKSQ